MKFKNYLFELYPDFPQDFDIKSIKEVDKVSNDLYDDLKKAFFDDNALKKIGLDNITKKLQNVGNGDYYTLFVDRDKFLLSADYIGASIYWAKKAGLSDIEIISYLFISRTIGGHIVFRGAKVLLQLIKQGVESHKQKVDDIKGIMTDSI